MKRSAVGTIDATRGISDESAVNMPDQFAQHGIQAMPTGVLLAQLETA